jgi:hypothetical protein
MGNHPDKAEHVRMHGAQEVAGKGQGKASMSVVSAANHSRGRSVGDHGSSRCWVYLPPTLLVLDLPRPLVSHEI